MSEKIRVRVSGLLQDETGRVLLVNHQKDGRSYWLLPGGGQKFSETITGAFRREMLEELGINVEVGDLLFSTESIAPAGNRHILHLIFLAQQPISAQTTFVSKDPRVVGAAFFEKKELCKIPIYPDISSSIMEFLETGHREKVHLVVDWID